MAGVHRRTHRRKLLPLAGPEERNRTGDAGKDSGRTNGEMAWRSKPEEKDILSLSRLNRCLKLAGRTADDAVLTLKSLLDVTPKLAGANKSFTSYLQMTYLLAITSSVAFRRSGNATRNWQPV